MDITEDDLDALVSDDDEIKKEPAADDSNPAEYAEAFGRSFVRGTPYVGSYADEVEATARAAKDALFNKDIAGFKSNYERYKNLTRNRGQELEKKYPITSGLGTAAQIAMPYGAVAKVPGTVGKIGEFLFPSGIKNKLLAGGIQGAMYQLGRLGEIGGYEEDGSLTPTGATSLVESALGGFGMAGLSRIPKKDVGQKAIAVSLGPKPEMQERYLADPEGVNKSPLLQNLAEDIAGDYKNLRKAISGESGKAYKILENVEGGFNLREAVERIDDSIARLKNSGDITSKGQEAIRNLQQQRANLIAKYPQLKQQQKVTTEKPPVDFVDFVNRDWNPKPPPAPPMSLERRMAAVKIPYGKAKDYLQGLDKMIDYDSDFNPLAKREFSGLRSSIDDRIKKVSPEYADQMKKVSEMAQVASEGQQVFGKKQQGSILAGLKQESGKYGIPIPKEEALKSLGKLFGKDFINKTKNVQARQAFEGTYANGSANVNFWRALASPLGKLGIDKEVVDASGAISGRAIDRFGPAMAKKILDLQLWLRDNPVSKTALDIAAQSEGARNFMITDMLIRKKFPQYRKIMEDLMPINNKNDDSLPDLEDLE